MITAEQLDKLEMEYRAASAARDDALDARNRAVAKAVAEGKTQAWVASILDCNRSRVGQIVAEVGRRRFTDR